MRLKAVVILIVSCYSCGVEEPRPWFYPDKLIEWSCTKTDGTVVEAKGLALLLDSQDDYTKCSAEWIKVDYEKDADDSSSDVRDRVQ